LTNLIARETATNSSQGAPLTSAKPLWLLAELSYACPLQCPYCSNPLNYPKARANELSTEQWFEVFAQARALGAVQLGLSGGEPLVRQDLEQLIGEARRLGYYTNLITSTLGANPERLSRLKDAGLDHIQISYQGSDEVINDRYAGTRSFKHKIMMTKAAKQLQLPMVMNFVLHRGNIHQLNDMLNMALELGADYVELANIQYYGWGLKNRDLLMPSREQLITAEQSCNEFRQRHAGKMDVLFVIPDYFEDRPKPCCNGWGTTFMTITPDGKALPCHAAGEIKGLEIPDVRARNLEWIWQQSSIFNAFRGDQWMQEPCRSCPEKETDFGGCRCQAFQLTGDASNTDPVCGKSPQRGLIDEAIKTSQQPKLAAQELIFRNPGSAKKLLLEN